MMLLHLQAMDNVPGLSLVDNLPSGFAGIGHLLRPSILLSFLATLVILSSIRAALLFIRPPSAKQSNKISIVREAVEKREASESDNEDIAGKSRTPTPPSTEDVQSARKPMSSWLWGLVKWDSLPSLPTNQSRTTNMSQTERGWHQPLQAPPRRPGAQYDPTVMYQSDVPLSMAKLIMSRHTFRRPVSRPPPVRSANAPQYQRRTPSMV